MRDLRLKGGVFSFDGRVLERFGFGSSESRRVHVAQLEGVDVKHKRLVGTVIKLEGFDGSLTPALDLDGDQQAQVDEFFAAVDAAVRKGTA